MIFVDANIFMYAAGRDSPQRRPCQEFLSGLTGSAVSCCTNTEVLQEILHRYRALKKPSVGSRIFDSVVQLGLPILAVGADDMRRARRLLQEHEGLSTRDGVHLGVMESHRLVDVLTYDKGFDTVPWARRLEP